MDLPNILNNKGPASAATRQLQHHFVKNAQVNGSALSDTGSERGMSHHVSDPSAGFSTRSGPQLHNLNMANAPRYTDSPHLQQQFSIIPNPYPTPTGSIDSAYTQAQQSDDGLSSHSTGQVEGSNQVKAFACSNCGKGFARRSDLARHERIHSGVRPHMCEYAGCGKQFIQRSALTVHARVHTGEKPHMCEHCTKPFSDSSSLARHRRIHSGKRPYKCPYADCQKTFTRRTTLTRHQSHHSGTVEESIAATNAALASRPPPHSQRTHSEGGTYSDAGSARSTPSPSIRTMSMSPSSDMPNVPLLPRHPSDFPYMPTGSIPPRFRGGLQHSPRSGSSSPSLSAFGSTLGRPSLTSHPNIPNMYGPPPTLEPPTHHEQRTPGSASGSPHLSSLGWQSPSHNGMGSPTPGDSYPYPEPPYGVPAPHLYYPSSNIRRPQSTEPDHYETKPRHLPGEVWMGPL